MKTANMNFLLIFGGIIVALVLGYFAIQYVSIGQCALCSISWTNIGTIPRADTPTSLNIGSVVNTYNSYIEPNGKMVSGLDKFNNCNFPLTNLVRYKEVSSTHEKLSIKSGSSYYIEDLTAGSANGAIFASCNGAYYRMFVNGLISCSDIPSTQYSNYGLDSSGNYSYVQLCSATGKIDIAIESNRIINFECTTDRSVTCSDGSVIVKKTCVNHKYVSTGNECPVSPPTQSTCTNSCPEGYSQNSYPDCTCVPPEPSGCENSCTSGQVQLSYPACTCVDVEESCSDKGPQWKVVDGICTDTSVPSNIPEDYTLVYCFGGLMLIGIFAAAYFFVLKKS